MWCKRELKSYASVIMLFYVACDCRSFVLANFLRSVALCKIHKHCNNPEIASAVPIIVGGPIAAGTSDFQVKKELNREIFAAQ